MTTKQEEFPSKLGELSIEQGELPDKQGKLPDKHWEMSSKQGEIRPTKYPQLCLFNALPYVSDVTQGHKKHLKKIKIKNLI